MLTNRNWEIGRSAIQCSVAEEGEVILMVKMRLEGHYPQAFIHL